MLKAIVIFSLGIVGCSEIVHAMPCHCFPTRKYDQAQPSAADPYFLATAQNSFMAIVFALDKKEIVLSKQVPASTAEGLWIAHWITRSNGGDPSALLKAKRKSGSWKDAVKSLSLDAAKLPPPFPELISKGASDSELSRTVVGSLLLEKRIATTTELALVRKAGASDQETILSSLIARKTKQKSDMLLRAVREGMTSWGGLLSAYGINGADMMSEIPLIMGEVQRLPQK